MNADELAQDRSRRDAALRRLFEGVPQFRGPGSGLTGKARVDQCLAARLRTGSRCRTTQSQHHRQHTNPQADVRHMETGRQACGDHVEIKA
jgi:hypothetical protein